MPLTKNAMVEAREYTTSGGLGNRIFELYYQEELIARFEEGWYEGDELGEDGIPKLNPRAREEAGELAHFLSVAISPDKLCSILDGASLLPSGEHTRQSRYAQMSGTWIHPGVALFLNMMRY